MNFENEARVSQPMLGSKAPEFSAKTTFGDIKLSDFEGKWVVMFSHPADFTPVCTTEFIAFAKYNPCFVQRNVQLIGLSIDSVYAHLAWVYNIYNNTGIEIPFPVIADLDMKVAKMYGMISPKVSETSTIRSVFIIDDKQVIRAILQYPQTTGRYIPEIIRMIDSLQTVDRDKVVTPANWVHGMPVVVPPPSTYQQLKERVMDPKGYSCMDWYLCMKPDKKSMCPKMMKENLESNQNTPVLSE
ncbi:MAG: peroxiredoxin [Clostridia bacterium]|nr:peroxiredoxin [Clostridia bacterium]